MTNCRTVNGVNGSDDVQNLHEKKNASSSARDSCSNKHPRNHFRFDYRLSSAAQK